MQSPAGHRHCHASWVLTISLLVGAAAAYGWEVSTSNAVYSGQHLADTDVYQFAGIRYATPPTGSSRWQHPRPPGPEDPPQTRDGAFPPVCMQDEGNVRWYRRVAAGFSEAPQVIAPTPARSEDCLYLNVWTPSPREQARLPVMVWIHGGSNVGGWSYEPNYHGNILASHGVVVVSIQYRLGVFGFLAHPELIEESVHGSAGNYGILDQIQSLKWIRRNISAFGGDPQNVTVFGESAGAGDIAYLLLSPLTAGLFHKAISQSGGWPVDHDATLGQQADAGADFAAKLGVDGIAAMRELTADELLEAAREHFKRDYDDPAIDGWLLPAPPAELLANGQFRARPFIAGTNRNERLMYVDPAASESAWHKRLSEVVGDPEARKAVNAQLKDLPMRQRLDVLGTATSFLCPSLKLADAVSRKAPVWVYRFDRVREGGDALGAYHGAEIPYVFGTHDAWLPTTMLDRELSRQMIGYWVAFARAGDPNDADQPHWSRWDQDHVAMIFGAQGGSAPRPVDRSLCSKLDPF